jgi:CubicO group peptidase (beta-lactamase class C family)
VRQKSLLVVLLSLVCLSSASDQPIKRLDGSTITPAQVDATVTRLMSAAKVTGVGIAILNDRRIAYLKTYGFRDKDKGLPLTSDSVMAGASWTKSAFAAMVMQLVGEGILDLDKSVYQYLPRPLPEYPQYKDLADDVRYKQITARMLLSHTAGFPNWRSLNGDGNLNINFAPGSRYAYSGEGMDLMQLVVETVTGKPLEELMQTRVFQPLGMARTSLIWQQRFENDYANGYDEWERDLGPQRFTKAEAAGSMLTTPRDFAQFIQAVMQGKVLKDSEQDLMLSPQIQILSKHEFPTLAAETTDANKPIRLSYGLGWGLYFTPYGKAFFKEGHSDGVMNYVACVENGTCLVIMTNSSNGEGIYKELLETLLHNTYTPIEWEGFTPYQELPPRVSPKQHTEVAVSDQVLDRYIGRYGVGSDILVVSRESGHLAIHENDEPVELIFAESERNFFAKTNDDEFTFEIGAAGRAIDMVLHTDGKDISIKRIE